ncbi:Transcriptional regulator of ribosomal biogenesis proteins [Physocladia obscura]|uniref:Transcriptional regulator of ribosomal biogenesis proteins n=1 Tax=Physocladia obscura TaxID=109957 RepID=A0AAD5T296_9FUNG|nr:Transcriptional regulator of ribosomal biogenesis proteins [Physocladia obscura]
MQLPSPTSSSASTLSANILSSKLTPSSDRNTSPTASNNLFSPKLSAAAAPGIIAYSQSPSLGASAAKKRTASTSALGNIPSLSSSLEQSMSLQGYMGSIGVPGIKSGFNVGSFGNEPTFLEQEFCKDFFCCGIVLPDLHELNRHIQEFHSELSRGESNRNNVDVSLEALLLNELILGPPPPPLSSQNLSKLTEKVSAASLKNESPKLSAMFTPPTSLSPELTSSSADDAYSQALLGETFDDESTTQFSFLDESAFAPNNVSVTTHPRRDTIDTLLALAVGRNGDIESKASSDDFDLLTFDDGVREDVILTADDDVNMDILLQLENMGMHPHSNGDGDEGLLEQSLGLMFFQFNATRGPLLNSGNFDSRSPPVAPSVRFGPHHERIEASSSISLAEIYRENEEYANAPESGRIPMPSTISLMKPASNYDSQHLLYSENNHGESDYEISDSSSSIDESDGEFDSKYWSSTDSSTNALFNYLNTNNHAKPSTVRGSLPLAGNSRRTLSIPGTKPTLETIKNRSCPSSVSRNRKATTRSSSINGRQHQRKSTKKMRVSTASLFSVQPPSYIVTASSPGILSPRMTSTSLSTMMQQQRYRKSQQKNSQLGGICDMHILSGADVGPSMVDSIFTTSGRRCDTSGRSTLSASIAALNTLDSGTYFYDQEYEDDDDEIGLATMAAEIMLKRKSGGGDAGLGQSLAIGTSSLQSAVVLRKSRGVSKSNLRKAAEANEAKAVRAAAAAASKLRKTAAAEAAAAAAEAAKIIIAMDPEFVGRFKTRAIAEQAAVTVEALKEGATLADLVIQRLPKVKLGEEKRLKLGLLSILDPDTAEKRFFCPVCKKEYKNANGLKYHLNHSHIEPNELPSGYYFGKKKKEAEDMSKPFVCTVNQCGKRYKNLNGLKYHIEHGHNMPGVANDVGNQCDSDESDDDSGNE